MEWISPRTITGDAATGERYFSRERINEEFWREIGKGNHILFVAPRRVGKTSIMRDLADNCTENYVCLYQNIEGVKTRNEFYRRLFTMIIQCLNRSRVQAAVSFMRDCLKKYGILEINTSGVKFSSKELDYEQELRELILSISDSTVHAVIFLDEFAEVINKMTKSGHKEDAIDILHTLREIRSYKEFKNFSIVFAGSVGLEFVIRNLDRPKLINDLHPIQTDALTKEEARRFILQLTKGATIQLTEQAVEHLLNVVEHLLPYYIQLMLEEIDFIARQQDASHVDTTTIEQAFENILQKNKNFEDWLVRLKEYQAEHFGFINTILKHAAHAGRVTIQEVYNFAGRPEFGREHDYMDFVEQLMNDGYLIESPMHTYKFISPFLKHFWLKKYPIYNVQYLP